MKKFNLFLTLFLSSSTLICCALPALFVALGMGASLAGLISTFPQLVLLSKYKMSLFILSGLMILVSFILIKKENTRSCPIDAAEAEICRQSKSLSKLILILSLFVWLTGFVFAFILPALIS